jgi:hypothetical protein
MEDEKVLHGLFSCLFRACAFVSVSPRGVTPASSQLSSLSHQYLVPLIVAERAMPFSVIW